MTREQAINYLISVGLTQDQVGDVVRALTYKPRDCANCKHYVVTDTRTNWGSQETTKIYGCECWECEYEPTTKNDLGVDCISREQALVVIRNLYPGMPRVDFNGSLRKWVDKYKPYIECDDAIKQLPSVTPQFRWIPVSERLPENHNQEVLMSLEWGIDIGRYSDGEWHSEWINHYDDGNVLAWMPLPQSYREVEE